MWGDHPAVWQLEFTQVNNQEFQGTIQINLFMVLQDGPLLAINGVIMTSSMGNWGYFTPINSLISELKFPPSLPVIPAEVNCPLGWFLGPPTWVEGVWKPREKWSP